eukprot:gene5311-18556_t
MRVQPSPSVGPDLTIDNPVLGEYDKNHDGKLDAKEVASMADDLRHERNNNKLLKRIVITFIVFAMLLVGAMTGLVWAITLHLKETEVSSSGMFISRETGLPVLVSSADTAVVDGVMMARSSAGAIQTPVQVATSTVPAKLSSMMPMEALKELKTLQITSNTGAQISLVVQAVAKIPAPFDGQYTSCEVLKIVTFVGTISVYGEQLLFEPSAHSLFVEAGFAVDNSGRRLLGMYDVIGFFNLSHPEYCGDHQLHSGGWPQTPPSNKL